jgi:integrase/recombinase XerD
MAAEHRMSDLRTSASEYLRLRRALGHKLDEAGRRLPAFVAFLEARGLDTVTIEAALAWAGDPAGTRPRTPGPSDVVPASRMTIARGFAKHLSGTDLRTEVPPVSLVPHRRHRAVPHLYSPADIAALMAQARLVPTPLRAATYETLIGLLAVTGMRVGEAIRLHRSDVDWEEAVLLVRASKFGKTRAVPLKASSIDVLATYARTRDRLCPRPDAPTFFVSTTGTQLIYANVSVTFRKLVTGAGIEHASAFRQPRIHDLRHSFAVATLLGW